jgi:fucose permease
LKEEEKTGAIPIYLGLIRNPTAVLFFLGIFFYVGCEQGVADWISKFLAVEHGYDPQTAGARAVSWFWGLMTIGTFVGLFLVKIFDSKKVLMCFTALAMVCLTLALFGGKQVAFLALPSIGFFASVMWPIILSLALNTITRHHGSLSGILITGIAGGAVVPLIIGWLGDMFGLKYGMFFLYLSFGYVFSVGIWARPQVKNKLFRFRKKANQPEVVLSVETD